MLQGVPSAGIKFGASPKPRDIWRRDSNKQDAGFGQQKLPGITSRSDKQRLLPTVALLRTGLATFAAHGSSPYKATFSWPGGLDGVYLVVLVPIIFEWGDLL